MGFSVFFTSVPFIHTSTPTESELHIQYSGISRPRTQTHFSLRTYSISNYPNSGLVRLRHHKNKKDCTAILKIKNKTLYSKQRKKPDLRFTRLITQPDIRLTRQSGRRPYYSVTAVLEAEAAAVPFRIIPINRSRLWFSRFSHSSNGWSIGMSTGG